MRVATGAADLVKRRHCSCCSARCFCCCCCCGCCLCCECCRHSSGGNSAGCRAIRRERSAVPPAPAPTAAGVSAQQHLPIKRPLPPASFSRRPLPRCTVAAAPGHGYRLGQCPARDQETVPGPADARRVWRRSRLSGAGEGVPLPARVLPPVQSAGRARLPPCADSEFPVCRKQRRKGRPYRKRGEDGSRRGFAANFPPSMTFVATRSRPALVRMDGV